MKQLTLAFSLLCLSVALGASVFGQQPASDQNPAQTIGTLSQKAQDDLAKSTQELAQLRDQVENEKLPLAQELTALEEEVTRLRNQHEELTRSVDAGNLALTNVKQEMKARQDELDYVGNLLDDYARSFESKVNVSELQSIGDAITSAKQATEDNTLSADEKFTRQIDFAKTSLARLFEVVGGMRFPGVGVDLQGTVAEGQFAIVGPVALFCAKSGAAGLVVAQSGSSKPLIRPLEGLLQAGIAAIVQGGEGLLPLDPSRGGALKALVQRTNIIHIFEKGGPIMWPLLCASILALGTVIERILFLMRERLKRNPKVLEAFFTEVGRGDTQAAIQTSRSTTDFVVRTLGYALAHKETSLASALLYAQQQELKRFRRGIPILDTVITVAPLLGLLGTVTGMMGSFSLIGGDLSAPGAITGGIAEALIATAFGLGIAITALLPFNILNTKLDEARHELESAATQLELLAHPSENVDAHAPAANSTAHSIPVLVAPRQKPFEMAGKE